MEAVRNSDCVIIITNHTSYDYEAILREAKFIFDSRNALGQSGKKNPKVARL
jgi:UDP-N-acetyl-D-glucosamine dehydrogenase